MKNKPISPFVWILTLFFVVVIPLLPILITSRWDWWEAWAFAIINVLGFAISRILAARRHPDIIAERAKFLTHENTQPWDQRLAPLVGLGSGLLPLVAGLEAKFGRLFTFGMSLKIAMLVIILAGYALASFALIENRFFSGTVRLQPERGHMVVSGGPYRWIRHPGYAGSLLTFITIPIFLDSLWAFIPAILVTVFLVIRTGLEDRFLQEQLPGYREYAGQVRYRLFPGLW